VLLAGDADVTAEFTGGCRDECESGATQCTAQDSQRTCGNFDDDPCLEWGAPTRCSGAEVCTYTRCGDTHELSVVPLPLDGQLGTVTSSPAFIDCGQHGDICQGPYLDGAQVTLTATSDDVATFDGWALLPLGDQTNGTACVGSTEPCTLTMTEVTTIAARFCTSECPAGGVRCSGATNVIETCGQFDDDRCTEFGPAVTCPAGQLCTIGGCAEGGIVTATASGFGRVAIDGVTCADTSCTEGVVTGGTARITPAPDPSSVFTGWSGDCSGTGECVVGPGASVTATFGDRCTENLLDTLPGGIVNNSVAINATDVYWTEQDPNGQGEPGAIRKRPLAGGDTTTITVSPPAFALVADATHLYWIANDSYIHGRIEIRRYGNGTEEVLATSQFVGGFIGAMTINATHIYYQQGMQLLRMPKAGGALELIAIGLPDASQGGAQIALDDTHVYWVGLLGGGVSRVPLSGGTREILASPIDPSSHDLQSAGIALDSDHVYWSQVGFGRIARVRKTGGPVETVVDRAFALTLAIDGDTLVWSGTGVWAKKLGTGVITELSRRQAGQGLAMNASDIYYAGGDLSSGFIATTQRTPTCAP
jgi:hypothetical protein